MKNRSQRTTEAAVPAATSVAVTTPTQSPFAAWIDDWRRGWEAFWFTPSQPHTLALIRILGGAMIFYTHLVWTKEYSNFLGAQPWVDTATSKLLNTDAGGTLYGFSHFWWIDSPGALWGIHLFALLCMAALTLGLYTRAAAIFTCFFTLSYCHRLAGCQFGLDQVNAMFALYLMIGRPGDVWSLDRWLAKRRAGGELPPPQSSVGNTIAIRLLQLHLCVIYLFGGIGKMRGESWWDGSALWLAFASGEYQSWDMTWMGRYPWLLAALTHGTVFWETFYPLIVWPRLTRPIALAMAVMVHAGIAISMGMVTFGTAMIIANLAFVTAAESRWCVERLTGRR